MPERLSPRGDEEAGKCLTDARHYLGRTEKERMIWRKNSVVERAAHPPELSCQDGLLHLERGLVTDRWAAGGSADGRRAGSFR
jgi:hypothetical protein